MRAAAVLAALATTLGALAGCSQPAPAAIAAATVLPSLTDLASCDWTYPDGTPVPCEAQATALEFLPAAPPGTVCVHRQPNDQGPDWDLLWSPANDRHGLHMSGEGNGTFGVVARVRSGDFVVLYTWVVDQEEGVVLFPEALPGDPASRNITMRFTAFRLGLDWTSLNHTMTTWHPLWSLYEKQFWLMYRVETDAGDYVFHGTRTRVLERRSGGAVSLENWHEPYSLNVTGGDFRLDATWTFLGFGRTPYELGGTVPDHLCSADADRATGR